LRSSSISSAIGPRLANGLLAHIHQTKDPTVCLGDDKDAGSSSSDDDESSEENLRISFAVEVSARLRVERPKSGLPLDLGLKRRMDGRVSKSDTTI
jgi:hypothetical protein